MLPWNVDPELAAMIRTGDVAYELLRPIDLYWLWYARAIAWRAASTTLRALPLFVLVVPLLGMRLPGSPAAAGAFLLTIVGALLLGCAITVLLTITLLWTISGQGVTNLVQAMAVVFSGMSVPLPLFPDWARPVLEVLPFRGLVDTPYRLYIGNLAPHEVWPLLAHQLAWTVFLVLLGRWLLARGQRRLVLQGG
jgi:ABC-2 type transport system permease protein